jgi:hypothetical protein
MEDLARDRHHLPRNRMDQQHQKIVTLPDDEMHHQASRPAPAAPKSPWSDNEWRLPYWDTCTRE